MHLYKVKELRSYGSFIRICVSVIVINIFIKPIKTLLLMFSNPQVDPNPYYQACLLESCSCEFEGKLLGSCTAVAASAEACSDQDVCIKWRTPDLCRKLRPFFFTYLFIVCSKQQLKLHFYVITWETAVRLHFVKNEYYSTSIPINN